MTLYPMIFEPLFQERIWGGRKLNTLFGKALPTNTPIGESWELADLPKGQSIVSNGHLKGLTLRSLMEQYGESVMGSPFTGVFPLLVKLLDAQDVLSVQVHPDAAACRRMGMGEPKTECWYIVAAEPDAVIYKGLKPGTTKAAFERAVENGTCADYLVKVPVAVGQCHFLPSGMCHAIGAGLVIAEIQQPSDTTYRVFDWNRTDAKTGQPRQLHIAEAIESIHFGDETPPPPKTVGRLVDAPEFKVDKGHDGPGRELLLKQGTMRVLVILTGGGTLTAPNTDLLPFAAGQTLLIPAVCQSVLEFAKDTEYLAITR